LADVRKFNKGVQGSRRGDNHGKTQEAKNEGTKKKKRREKSCEKGGLVRAILKTRTGGGGELGTTIPRAGQSMISRNYHNVLRE